MHYPMHVTDAWGGYLLPLCCSSLLAFLLTHRSVEAANYSRMMRTSHDGDGDGDMTVEMAHNGRVQFRRGQRSSGTSMLLSLQADGGPISLVDDGFQTHLLDEPDETTPPPPGGETPENVAALHGQNEGAGHRSIARDTDMAVTCEWAGWGEWSECSGTCGEQIKGQSRIRHKLIDERNGGACPGNPEEYKRCEHAVACPVDCEFGEWSEWGECSHTCGPEGIKFRDREIVVPVQFAGAPCVESHNATAPCNREVFCPINCEWNDWTVWEDCTKTCGFGVTWRNRTMNPPAGTELNGGTPCQGEPHPDNPSQLLWYGWEKGCSEFHCPIDCTYSDWTVWGSCSVSCGGGIKTRSRNSTAPQHGGAVCNRPTEYLGGDTPCRRPTCLPCNVAALVPCPVDCAFHDWSEWSACSLTCSTQHNGTRSRTREHDVATPAFGGELCAADGSDLRQEEVCVNENECPIDCVYGSWSDWTLWSTTCGPGQRGKYKHIATPSQHGGVPCGDYQWQNETRNESFCPQDCVVDDWSSYGECSAPTGTGIRTRMRQVLVSQEHGGHPCPAVQQNETCTAATTTASEDTEANANNPQSGTTNENSVQNSEQASSNSPNAGVAAPPSPPASSPPSPPASSPDSGDSDQ